MNMMLIVDHVKEYDAYDDNTTADVSPPIAPLAVAKHSAATKKGR